jgi:crotonobetainyl-CoA:carnitine CoA-transferase CaiB-like acyl-CoA transferase
LSGITVLDISRLLPGPYCSMILADHGARVIAIEDRRYAGEFGATFTVLRNKSHMTLNLKSEAGRGIFYGMAKKADVILEGFRPGVAGRLGVDYEAVSAVNPRIIYCSITGYGQEGPCREVAGHDVNYLSVSGVLDLIGERDRPPSIPGIQIADLTGGMNGVIGILLALYAREKTGRGQYIDISMTDGSLSLMPLVMSFRQITGSPVTRSDSILSHRYACYNTYETADKRYLSIGAVENRFWKNLCNYFGVPEYIPLQYDDSRKQEIIDFYREKIREKSLAYWESAFSSLDICWGPVRTLDEALEAPLFCEREMVLELKAKDGQSSKVLGIPVKLSNTPGSVRTPPPGFGEDTQDILRELGYSNTQIRRLLDEGVI